MSPDAQPGAVGAVEVGRHVGQVGEGVDGVVEHGEPVGRRRGRVGLGRLAPLEGVGPVGAAVGVVPRDDAQPVRLEDHDRRAVADARPRTRRSRPRTRPAWWPHRPRTGRSRGTGCCTRPARGRSAWPAARVTVNRTSCCTDLGVPAVNQTACGVSIIARIRAAASLSPLCGQLGDLLPSPRAVGGGTYRSIPRGRGLRRRGRCDQRPDQRHRRQADDPPPRDRRAALHGPSSMRAVEALSW